MRTRWMLAALAPALFGAAPARHAAEPLAALGFMAGCWRGPGPGGAEIEETWTAADADAMLATTRYLRDGRVVGWEFSRIHADSSGIHLTPYPDGRARDPFRLRSSGDDAAVFTDEANDFPRDIVYRGDGGRALVVRLEGGGRALEWRMTSCAAGG